MIVSRIVLTLMFIYIHLGIQSYILIQNVYMLQLVLTLLTFWVYLVWAHWHFYIS